MRRHYSGASRIWLVSAAIILLASTAWAHVTFRAEQPLRPGGYAQISMLVPTERSSDTVRVTLEVPEAFLKAGGRLSRIEFPTGWQVKIDKEDKPGEIYAHEMDQRAKRNNDAERAATPKTPSQLKEQQISDEMRKKWIKKITFEGGMIPPDGFQVFSLDFQLPNASGEYRFPAIQTYADGEEVSWTELVQGAQHPAPSIVLGEKREGRNFQDLAIPMSGLALLVSLSILVKQYRKNKAD
jgi:uncharacterized protein YcnI